MGVRLVVHNFIYDEMDYTGTHNHEEMLHRDWVDQHPIYAITGLQEVLNTIEENLINITNTLLQKEQDLTNYLTEYTDTSVNGLSITLNNKIDNLDDIYNFGETDTAELSFDKDTKTLYADVKIYNDPDDNNSITKSDQGLYVPKFVTQETKTVKWYETSDGESFEEIINEGIRFSHNDTNSYSNVINPTESNAWYYNSNLNAVIQPLETNTYNGIISRKLYNNYKHSVRITSLSANNSINGIVLGFVFDEYNHPHTLSELIQRGNNLYLNFRFAIIYNYRLPGETLVSNTGLTNSGTNWDTISNGISLFAIKENNEISVSITSANYVNNNTDINDAENMTFEKTINIDLDDYSWGRYFDDKVRYGYSNMSQAESYFDKMFFYSDNIYSPFEILANVKLSEDENNSIEVHNDGLYSEKFMISNEPDNAISKKQDGYYVRANAMALSNTRLNGLYDEGDGVYYVHKSHSFVNINQANHGFVVGDFIYYDNRTYLYDKAIAIDDFNINIIGVVSYIYDKDNFEYICNGFFETDLFTESNGFIQGMPIYISDTEAGKVTQQQPDISKTVGYPIGNSGIIINIERGIQYGKENDIGDFKISANDYTIRSDGFIKVTDTVDFKLSLVNKLITKLDETFVETYIVINDSTNTMNFTNVDQLYAINNVKEGLNLFIKAF